MHHEKVWMLLVGMALVAAGGCGWGSQRRAEPALDPWSFGNPTAPPGGPPPAAGAARNSPATTFAGGGQRRPAPIVAGSSQRPPTWPVSNQQPYPPQQQNYPPQASFAPPGGNPPAGSPPAGGVPYWQQNPGARLGDSRLPQMQPAQPPIGPSYANPTSVPANYTVPGNAGSPASYPPNGGAPAEQAAAFTPAQILAQVGDQFILAGDVEGLVRQTLDPHRDKLTASQYEEQTQLITRAALKKAVETKLLYIAFLREIPEDKRKEALPRIRRKVFEEFDKKELEKAIKKAKVKTAADLDAKLREYGSSLQKQKEQYMEIKLGRAAIGQNIKVNPEITHAEMLDYYREHQADYAFPSRVRWEKLTVLYEKFPNRAAAHEAIRQLGNEVLFGGAPLSAVARRSSQGLDASDGGHHDWTTQGSLRSKPLDAAIFALPVGKLSTIIPDERGFHIVRVLERQEAGRTPFVEAQVEIKSKLLAQKRSVQIKEFIERLRTTVYVWTVYGDIFAPPTPGSGPPSSG